MKRPHDDVFQSQETSGSQSGSPNQLSTKKMRAEEEKTVDMVSVSGLLVVPLKDGSKTELKVNHYHLVKIPLDASGHDLSVAFGKAVYPNASPASTPPLFIPKQPLQSGFDAADRLQPLLSCQSTLLSVATEVDRSSSLTEILGFDRSNVLPRHHVHVLILGDAVTVQCSTADLTNQKIFEKFQDLDGHRLRYLQSSVALTYTPSDVVKDANYYHMQGSDERIYDGMLGGTGSAIAPPIELFCRTFAYFKGLYANKALPIPSEKLPWVAQLITFSSLIFVHEANRRAHIQQIFRKILGRGFSCIHNVDNTKLDYCIIGDSMLLSVFEDAQRWGPDPGVLAGASYRRYYLQLDNMTARESSCCPAFLIALAGSYIQILGAVFVGGAIVQRLTDYIWLGRSRVDDRTQLENVARVLESLSLSLDALEQVHKSVEPNLFEERFPVNSSDSEEDEDETPGSHSRSMKSNEQMRTEADPKTNSRVARGKIISEVLRLAPLPESHPRFYPDIRSYSVRQSNAAGVPEVSEIKFNYLRPLDNDQACITFLAQETESRRKIVVKFVPTYCSDAHLLLANHEIQLAPKLYYFGKIEHDERYSYGDLRMVVMEYAEEGKTLDVRSLDDDLSAKVKILLLRALEVLHDQGFVLGDLRPPNILVIRKKDDVGVRLVDFDWAGKVGEVRYPCYLSKAVMKAGSKGGLKARDNVLIEKDHDNVMLDALRLTSKSYLIPWRDITCVS